jgi:Ca2+-binding EF-hand superfamily protein
MKRKGTELAIGGASAILAAGALIMSGAFAQRASVPKAQDKIALGEGEVKQLLLLMDTDKNGKISKQEYMAFMEKEFDRLDKDKSGELDPKELTQSSFRVARPFSAAGK